MDKYSNEILELDSENICTPMSDTTWARTLYNYVDNKLLLVNNRQYLHFSNDNKAIKYTSDDLQDCINIIKTIIDQEKYNI